MKRAAFAILIVLAGCSAATPTTRLVIPEDLFALPVVTALPASCRSVILQDAVLSGQRDDPLHGSVWVDQRGKRIDVVFAPGYQGLLSRQLEILDPSGRTVARGGDAVNRGCLASNEETGPLLILYPPLTGS